MQKIKQLQASRVEGMSKWTDCIQSYDFMKFNGMLSIIGIFPHLKIGK